MQNLVVFNVVIRNSISTATTTPHEIGLKNSEHAERKLKADLNLFFIEGTTKTFSVTIKRASASGAPILASKTTTTYAATTTTRFYSRFHVLLFSNFL